jgi:4-hydroxy-2-oxoheptanedioate aldolase
MLRKNFVKEKLKSGKNVLGTWSIIPSIIVSDIIASTGIDFIIIDSEHGPVTYEIAQNLVIACESRNVSPIMRVSGVVESDILKALDIGVHGIQIPNVTTERDIEMAMNFAKYPPIGNRGFSPFTRAGCYSADNATELHNFANGNVLIIIHVEGLDAINNIERILEINDLDVIFIGIYDISKSLGIPGDVNNPKVIEILKTLTAKINNAGKYPGTIVTNIDQLKVGMDFGIKYFTYSVDCSIIKSNYQKIVDDFKKIDENFN